MAPSYVYVVKREDSEGDVSILSAHATKKSADDAANEENGTAEVEKVELIGGTITKAKTTSNAPSKKKQEASAEIPDANPSALAGQTVLFTGELARMTRKEAQALAESAGASTVTSVTKAVTLVVLGQRAGPDKMKKIEKMGLETMDEDSFLEMIKGDGPASSSKRAASDDDDGEDVDDDEEEEKPAPKKAKKAKA